MKRLSTALIILVPLLLHCTEVIGAANVVEAQSSIPGQRTTSSSNSQGSGNEALQLLLDQSNQQQQQLEQLLGMFEELSFRLKRLEKDSLDRYTDLDSRVSGLSQPTPSAQNPAISPQNPSSASRNNGGTLPPVRGRTNISTPVPNTTTNNASAPASVSAPVRVSDSRSGSIQPRVLSDLQLYQTALDSLLQNDQYERAVTEFDQYLSVYPNGQYVANAWYWKGQSFDNLSLFSEAKEAYELILNRFPDNPKAVDSMYALGVVLDRMGDTAASRRMLRELVSKYANSGAANLADIYLRSLD